jgi:hypothetical protein
MKKLILFIISTTIFCINLSAQKATVDNSTISVYFVNLTNKKTNLINNLIGISFYANTKFGKALIHSELFYTISVDKNLNLPNFKSFFGVKEGFGGTFLRGKRYNLPFAFYAGLGGTKNDASLKGGLLFGFALEFRYFVTHTNAINLAIKTDYFTQSGSWAKGITLGYSLASSKKVKE